MKIILLSLAVLLSSNFGEVSQQKIDLEFTFDIDSQEEYELIKTEMKKYSSQKELLLIEKAEILELKTKKKSCYKYSIKLQRNMVAYKYKGCKPRGKTSRRAFFDILKKSSEIKKVKG